MTHHKSIIQHALDGLDSIYPESVYGSDLHHELFNRDYFVVTYYRAEQWINEVGGAFRVIAEIQNYEVMNFGDCSTNFGSSESVANMYAYILGENLLHDLETLKDKWESLLTESDIDSIIEELKALF